MLFCLTRAFCGMYLCVIKKRNLFWLNSKQNSVPIKISKYCYLESIYSHLVYYWPNSQSIVKLTLISSPYRWQQHFAECGVSFMSCCVFHSYTRACDLPVFNKQTSAPGSAEQGIGWNTHRWCIIWNQRTWQKSV